MNEAETPAEHIDPALREAGWDIVDELAAEKLSPLLRLKYNNAIAGAVADLGQPEEINNVFSGFQKYLYNAAA